MVKPYAIAVLLGALYLVSNLPAQGQFTASYDFIKAVRESDHLKARQMLKKGLTANVRDGDGQPVLVIAATNGDTQMLELLLDSGANIDGADRVDGETALMSAVSIGHMPGMELLINRGADVNERDRRGETALIKAAKLRRGRLATQLLDAGADPEIVDYQGWTALDHARQARARSVIRALEKAS